MKPEGPVEELKHQGADFRFPAVVKSVIVFVVVNAILFVTMWWLYRYGRREDMSRDVRPSLVEAKPPIPPEPRLQVNPREDFQEYLRKQQNALTSYGWVSRPEGKVRIPIDRAMQLIVERQGQK
jgi:hypothetical protein